MQALYRLGRGDLGEEGDGYGDRDMGFFFFGREVDRET